MKVQPANVILIDFGNTAAKVWLSPAQIETFPYTERWTEQACDFLRSLSPRFIAIASVAPQRTAEFLNSCDLSDVQIFQLSPEFIATHSTIDWSTVSGIGIDRMLQLVGATYLSSPPVIVVSAGTAITLTAADAQRRCIGGMILPGIELQLRCLHQHTAQLPLASPSLPPHPYGNTPETAIQTGVLYGTAGAIHHLVSLLSERLQPPIPQLFLTGGNATLLQQLLPQHQWKFVPDLLFIGMQTVLAHSTLLPPFSTN